MKTRRTTRRRKSGNGALKRAQMPAMEDFIINQRRRLLDERDAIQAQQDALQVKMEEIDNEITALDTYEKARVGGRLAPAAPAPARSRRRQTRTPRPRKTRTARTRSTHKPSARARIPREPQPRTTKRARKTPTRKTRRAGLTPSGIRGGGQRSKCLSVIVAEPGLNRSEIRERMGLPEGADNKVSNMLTALTKINLVNRENRRYYPVAEAAENALAQFAENP